MEELWRAARSGNLSKVKEFINGGTDIDEKGGFLKGTPLLYAAFGGHIDIVDYLIKNGADVHCEDQDDSSPLHLASSAGHLEVVKLLLIKGSDITSRNNYGSTALHRACYGGHTAVVDYLLQRDADMESRDKEGYSPFHNACFANEFHVVQYLIRKGCDITATTKAGRFGPEIAEIKGGKDGVVANYIRTKLQERQVDGDLEALAEALFKQVAESDDNCSWDKVLKECIHIYGNRELANFVRKKIGETQEADYDEAYQRALQYGEEKSNRIPVMIIGQDRAGKTSLRKRLLGKPFDPEEPSTVGIHVDFIEVTDNTSSKPWKPRSQQRFFVGKQAAKDNLLKMTATEVRERQENLDQSVQPIDESLSPNPPLYQHIPAVPIQPSKQHQMIDMTPSAGSTCDEQYSATSVAESISSPILPPSPTNQQMSVDLKRKTALGSKTAFKPTPSEKRKVMDFADLNEETKTPPVRMIVHDLAGQAIYYDTHYLFLKPHCPHILVHDLTKELDLPAQPRFKTKNIDVELESANPLLATNLDYLLSWLTVLEQLGESESQNAEFSDFVPPPVLIVLTNKDRFEGNIEEVKRRIKEVTDKFGRVLGVYVIDNATTSGSEVPIRELRSKVFELCQTILEKEVPMPTRWLKFEAALREKLFSKKKRNYIPVEEAEAIAEKCNVDDFDNAIKFLNRQSMVVYYSGSPMVVLNPQWLMNLFTKVITVHTDDEVKAIDGPYLRELRDNGILMQEFLRKNEHGELLEEVMQRVSLMCPLEHKGKSAFLVPSVAPFMKEGKPIDEKLNGSPIASLFVNFLVELIPPGVFTRIQVKLIRKCREMLREFCKEPRLFCNYTLLPLEFDNIKFEVYLIQLIDKIKIGVVPKTTSSPQSLVGKFAARLKGLLEDCLIEIESEEPLFYRGLRYEFLVKCTACSKVNEVPCRRHSKIHCSYNECSHMQPLEKIQQCPSESICCNFTQVEALEFHLNRVKFWCHDPKDSSIDESQRDNRNTDGALSSAEVTSKKSILVRDLDSKTRDLICQKLNVKTVLKKDFRGLAAKMKYETEEIEEFGKFDNPTEALLNDWQFGKESTVEVLKKLLQKIKRNDVIDILEAISVVNDESIAKESTDEAFISLFKSEVQESCSGDVPGSSAVGEARSENPKDSVPKTFPACSGHNDAFGEVLTGPRPAYENHPRVFPVLSGKEVLGTGFVLQWQNKCYVISPSIPGKRCYALIPVQYEFQRVDLTPGSEDNNLVSTSLKEDSRMLKLSLASKDSLDNGKKIYMVSRWARCRSCAKFQTKCLSKSCQVESAVKGSYNYKKKRGPFKDYPRGAPVVNRKNEVVGIIKSYEKHDFEVAAVDMLELEQRGVTLLKDQGRTSPSS